MELTLHDLPCEVLEGVLSAVNMSSAVLSLWKCGDKKLNYLISNGGCTRIDLEDKTAAKPKFPKMLIFLRKLRHLSITTKGTSVKGDGSLSSLLNQLSSTLETLKLSCPEAESCLLNITVHDPHKENTVAVPGSKAYFLPQNGGKSCVKYCLWDLEAKFPNLTSLSLETESQSVIAPLIGYLPSPLTFLSIRSPGHLFAPDFQGGYPPQLHSLRVSWELPVDSLSSLPPTIKTVDYPLRPSMISTHLQALPKTIEELPWSIDIAPYTIDILPPSLTDLSTFNIGQFSAGRNWAAELPRSLKTFGKWDYSTLTEIQLRSLPSSVTRLGVSTLDWFSIRPSDFPTSLTFLKVGHLQGGVSETEIAKLPNLTQLSIPGNAKIEIYDHLPKSLQKLSFNSFDKEPKSMAIPALPPHLTEWKAYRIAITNDSTKSQKVASTSLFDLAYPTQPTEPSTLPPLKTNAFPSTLTYLSLWSLEPSLLSSLPRYFHTLALSGQILHVDDIAKLPRALLNLVVGGFTGILSKDKFGQLPRTLVSLSYGMVDSELRYNANAFQGFPDSLMKLEVPQDHYSKILPFMLSPPKCIVKTFKKPEKISQQS